MMQTLRAFVSRNQKFIPLTATAALGLLAYGAGAIFYPGMSDLQVFLNIFRNNTFLLISAVGMTLVIISGGIDLSVSGVVALTTVASAALLRAGWNAWAVILLMLAMGMALGAIMGGFIAYLKVQPFIATLAGMWFARGMCFFISDDAIAIDNPTFRLLGQTRLLIPGLTELAQNQGKDAPFISIPVAVAILVFLATMYVAHLTRFGRTIYAMGGGNGANEVSSRLMGLPVDRTKVLVYTFSGFCSGLAGVAWAIFVLSGHGLYAQGFELDVIAAVVMGGTMLTGGEGYVFGTLFGALIFGITQTLIQFNGALSSWWTRIVIGALTFVFIGVQSILAARRGRRDHGRQPGTPEQQARDRRRRLAYGGAAVATVGLLAAAVLRFGAPGGISSATADAAHCELQPFRPEFAENHLQAGAVLTYERNGGPRCVDETYAIYEDGSIVASNGVTQVESRAEPEEVQRLLQAIRDHGWYTDDMYDTWHTPCGQCYGYFVTVVSDGEQKSVKGVGGGTDAPAEYWQVISLVKGLVPAFAMTP
jgi:ribose/xylose/arabinose/galactoside ABC-type transport system permease subunit